MQLPAANVAEPDTNTAASNAGLTEQIASEPGWSSSVTRIDHGLDCDDSRLAEKRLPGVIDSFQAGAKVFGEDRGLRGRGIAEPERAQRIRRRPVAHARVPRFAGWFRLRDRRRARNEPSRARRDPGCTLRSCSACTRDRRRNSRWRRPRPPNPAPPAPPRAPPPAGSACRSPRLRHTGPAPPSRRRATAARAAVPPLAAAARSRRCRARRRRRCRRAAARRRRRAASAPPPAHRRLRRRRPAPARPAGSTRATGFAAHRRTTPAPPVPALPPAPPSRQRGRSPRRRHRRHQPLHRAPSPPPPPAPARPAARSPRGHGSPARPAVIDRTGAGQQKGE